MKRCDNFYLKAPRQTIKFQVVPVGAGRVTQGAEVAILLAKPLSNEHRLKGMAEGSALLTSSSS